MSKWRIHGNQSGFLPGSQDKHGTWIKDTFVRITLMNTLESSVDRENLTRST